MTATPPALVDQLDRLLGGRPAPRHEGLGARHQVLLEEGAQVAGRARGAGDVGAADRERVAGLADRVLEVQVEALPAQLLDDLRRPGSPARAGPARRPAAIFPRSTQYPQTCRSSAYSCTQDISIAGTSSIPSRSAASAASATPAIASWSVSASVVTPALAASSTTSAGASCPSETVEWL